MPLRKWTRTLNAAGAVCAAVYLIGALVFGPKLAFRDEDKQDLLARIEAAPTGREASVIARPFLSLMMNVINSANGALLLSCAVVLFNGCILLVNVFADGKRDPRS